MTLMMKSPSKEEDFYTHIIFTLLPRNLHSTPLGAKLPTLRPQYHFRKSELGLLSWDVRHLIEASKNLKVKTVMLSSIKEVNENYWYDLGETQPTCRNVTEHARLIREADLQHPIILCRKGEIMDGMHRVCKAILNGHKKIKAVQFEIDIKPSFIGISPENLPYLIT